MVSVYAFPDILKMVILSAPHATDHVLHALVV
jgi:hypothetical protein